ncbi:hypothetical protein HNQ35_002827 [Cerasibacillus quisquiliarum]|uniref:Phospholipase A2 domain-containing protein n=1 Tax=Cerasibacillus quisquiliarum TaxID=227865 RepID=A0A511V0U3_9BACI|nr:hypothetical protein [Cerasibacillus quisquiliarum]MBB5147597.1 hypothetical protein [Cerasibacillus quisquiliarum]GEN32525.1 hypothetical protein CQU01_27630 [Cerasibacillus quisquiliarum]
MKGKIYDGKILVGDELISQLNKIKSRDKFKKMIENMKLNVQFNPDELKVKKAYAFDAGIGSNDMVINFSSSIIYLVNTDESIGILYNELPMDDHIIGRTFDKVKNALTTYDFKEKDTINVIENNVENVAELFNDYEEELPNNPDYIKGKFISKNGLGLSSWWNGDGCLPGGYQHCGGNCGYPPRKHGGGTPINATDRCCVGHDRCYANFGNNDPCCDKTLINCVKGHTTVAAAGIRIYFKRNASRC